MIRRPPRSTLFPTRRSSDLGVRFASGDRGRSGGSVDVCGRHIRVAIHIGIYIGVDVGCTSRARSQDRKSTRLNSSHSQISYAVFCLKKKKKKKIKYT